MKTQFESFEDIVFENRNKEYGAYDLRRKYSKRGSIALFIALVIVSFLVGGPLIANILNHRKINLDIGKNVIIDLTTIKSQKEDITPPPPPPPTPPVISEIKFVVPTIVEELTNPESDGADIFDIGSVTNKPVDTSSGPIVIIVEPPKEKIDNIVYESFAIQEKPVYPGGDAELIKFVGEHTKYPVPALERGIEGTVYIRFVVTKTGEIGNANLLRSIDPLLDEEALRVIKTLPKWTPGKNNGNPVNVWFIIPVKFKITQQN